MTCGSAMPQSPTKEAVAVDIEYATRSRFLDACESAIRSHRADLDGGGTVYIDLGEGG